MKGWVMVAPNGIETDEALTVWLNKARDVTQTLPPKIVKAPRTIYNVKKAVWHTHTLSPDAMILVVENRDTTYDNSPFCPLTAMQRKTICEMAADQGL